MALILYCEGTDNCTLRLKNLQITGLMKKPRQGFEGYHISFTKKERMWLRSGVLILRNRVIS